MAEEHDLPSDSDDSDEDFKPADEESLPSEEESDGSVEEPLENEEETNLPKGKRKKRQSKHRTKVKKKNYNDEPVEDKEEVKQLSVEEEKKKADSLWNDFMKDCKPPARKATTVTDSTTETKDSKSPSTKSSVIEKENNAVVKQIFEFAGEKIVVEKEIPAQAPVKGRGGLGIARGRGRGTGGGLASLVGQLGKKNKLSTLEKSKLDWDRFKKEEGIEEDLQKHNKGKEGFLERQDFLQRADLRQFEIEKQLRTTSRSNR